MNVSSHALIGPYPWEDAALRSLRVLFVEDDEADAYLIERALNRAPSVRQSVRARNGEEALALLDSGDVLPDLAIIDLQMPRKNGLSLLIDLNYRAVSFPMVVLTSSTTRSDAIRSKLRGAVHVLTKPHAADDWDDMLSEALKFV